MTQKELVEDIVRSVRYNTKWSNKEKDPEIFNITTRVAKREVNNYISKFLSEHHNKLIADIRNKLTPVKNLCVMLKESELMYDLDVKKHKLIEKEIEQVLKTVEYLNNLKLK